MGYTKKKIIQTQKFSAVSPEHILNTSNIKPISKSVNSASLRNREKLRTWVLIKQLAFASETAKACIMKTQ